MHTDHYTHFQPFEIKANLLATTQFRLQTDDLEKINQSLESRLKQAPNFFQNMIMMIEIATHIDPDPHFLLALLRTLRTIGVTVLGFYHSNPNVQKTIATLGYRCLDPKNPSSTHKQDNKQLPTRMIVQPIRSGQHIQAPHQDLVIVGSVSQGAEVIAKGNIYIFGTLRGKAIAGMFGDPDACIVAQKFDAELIAISGRYQSCAKKTPSQPSKHALASLENERLIISEVP